jgi:hypothetical protein
MKLPYFILVIFISKLLVYSKKVKKVSRDESSDRSKTNEITVTSKGLKFQLSDKRSAPTITRWIQELEKDSYTVSHAVAVQREQEVQ